MSRAGRHNSHRHPLNAGSAQYATTQKWWKAVDERKKEAVRQWLRENPPPDTWDAGLLDWAYTEHA